MHLLTYRHSGMFLAGEVVHGRTVYGSKDEIYVLKLLDSRLKHAGMTVIGAGILDSG